MKNLYLCKCFCMVYVCKLIINIFYLNESVLINQFSFKVQIKVSAMLQNYYEVRHIVYLTQQQQPAVC